MDKLPVLHCSRLLTESGHAGINYWPPNGFRKDGQHVHFGQHFSGNFWWTTREHWMSLPEQARHTPECLGLVAYA